jgi:putative addiction module killer protein
MVPKIRVLDYVNERGVSPFAKWLLTLDTITRARVRRHVDRLADGNLSNVKSVGSGVHELRMDFGAGYRAYFAWRGETLVILLGGGSKQRQADDIAKAKALWMWIKEQDL